MVLNISKLSSNYQITADKIGQQLPVTSDRLLDVDRNVSERVPLVSNATNTLNPVKTGCEKTFVAFKGYQTTNNKYSIDFYGKVNKEKQAKALKRELINFSTSPIPMLRRFVGIKNNQDDHNPVKATGLAVVAALNVKEDIRDMLSAVGKSKSAAPDGYYSKYGFFVGTPIEKFLNKSEVGRKISDGVDITVGETKLVKKILKKFGIEIQNAKISRTVKHLNGKEETLLRNYVKVEGRNISKILLLSMHRMPVIGLVVASLLELPSVFKAKKEDKLKQTANSALNVVCGAACGALLSATAAVLVPQFVGLPVMALGLGYYLGSKISGAVGFNLTNK